MRIDAVTVKAFEFPTTHPERDGTLVWKSTKLVTVEVTAGNKLGLGYTYADQATGEFIAEHALALIKGSETSDHLQIVEKIKRQCRNLGNSGVASMALSAVDTALWDLKACLMDVSIQELLGKRRESVPFYGSGLFIDDSEEELREQIKAFQVLGLRSFKMKIGQTAEQDLERIKKVKAMIGEEAELFVDANGRYHHREALWLAHQLANLGVTWFEEPITSDDHLHMKFLQEHFPPRLNYVAGEYANQQSDFFTLLNQGLVDILQVDATRCEGVSGALSACHLARAYNVPVSTHCAPLLHAQIGCCLDNLQISEHFWDHKRIEDEFFISSGHFKEGQFFPAQKQKGFGWALGPKSKRYQIYELTA